MSKRAADVQLTADTVQESDSEEPGQFQVASEEELAHRVIKKAKRGHLPEQGSGLFTGLKLANGSQSAVPLHALPSSLLPLSAPPPAAPRPSANAAYLQQLRELNHSVSEWIARHVRENAHVDLTPIFKDYQLHLSNIDAKFRPGEAEIAPAPPTSEGSVTPPIEDVKSHDSSEPDDSDEHSTLASQESQPESSSSREPSQEEHAQPAHTDCLHSVRAKLFYKKGSSFTELGVGTLRVEAAAPGTVRLLLRNDTKLGKVLLNVKVSADIPLSSKSNNVFVVCVPNPPLSKEEPASPATYLVRVKTADSAAQLLTVIKKNTSEQ